MKEREMEKKVVLVFVYASHYAAPLQLHIIVQSVPLSHILNTVYIMYY